VTGKSSTRHTGYFATLAVGSTFPSPPRDSQKNPTWMNADPPTDRDLIEMEMSGFGDSAYTSLSVNQLKVILNNNEKIEGFKSKPWHELLARCVVL